MWLVVSLLAGLASGGLVGSAHGGAPLVEVDEWKPPQPHRSDCQQGGAKRPDIDFLGNRTGKLGLWQGQRSIEQKFMQPVDNG